MALVFLLSKVKILFPSLSLLCCIIDAAERAVGVIGYPYFLNVIYKFGKKAHNPPFCFGRKLPTWFSAQKIEKA